MKITLKIIVIGFLSLGYFSPSLSFASSIYIENIPSIVNLGDEFKVDVMLDSDVVSINALEAKLSYPKDTLEIRDIQTGNSKVTLWMEEPRIDNSGSTTFSGIIPGGYRGTKGYLFSVVFKSLVSGQALIKIQEGRVVQNTEDTKTEIIGNDTHTIGVSKTIGTTTISLSKDDNIPEIFKPIISRNENILDGKYFIAFVTQDKGVGIDHYEIKEGRLGKYVRANSPYVLENQTGDALVYVKAIDKNKNERIEVAYGPTWKPFYRNPYVLGFAMLLLLVVALRRKRK